MKKILIISISVLVVLTLVAWNNEDLMKVNTISVPNKSVTKSSELQLDENQEQLELDYTDMSFEFDFNVNGKYNGVSLWVEKYEFGEKVDDATNHVTAEIEGNGKIVFTSVETSGGLQGGTKERFSISINSDKSDRKVNSIQGVLPNHEDNYSSSWGSNEAANNPITENMVLASICYSFEDGVTSPSSEFYNDLENNINEIKDIDEVYLLRCEFTD